jgi:hypothetical protein
MLGSSQGDLCAKLEGRFYDAHVVGGNDNLIENLRIEATRPDVLDKRLSSNTV